MTRLRTLASWALVLCLVMPASSSAGPLFAVWLDGCTETNSVPNVCPNGGTGGNGIPFSLTAAFGAGSFELVTTDDLNKIGFLDKYDAVIISRFGNTQGTALGPPAVDNIRKYVGTGPGQGGVAAFMNDAADSLCNPVTFPSACLSSDPYDATLNQLFINAATLVAATHHGYIGELNGAVMAFSDEQSSSPFPAIGLLAGKSTIPLNIFQPDSEKPVGFLYNVGPIGAGHPIDEGVTFPFTTQEVTLFLGLVTGADEKTIVDQFGNRGLLPDIFGAPAIVANAAAIDGTFPPPSVPAPPTLVLIGLGLVALGAIRRGPRSPSRDN